MALRRDLAIWSGVSRLMRGRRATVPVAPSEGNELRLLVDGAQAYPAMLAAIAGARVSVLLETYILASDDTGWRFAQALVDAAGRGLAVLVVYDGFGSLELAATFESFLRAGGVALASYNPPTWRALGRLQRRDHRKILVVDGALAFTGGLNIGDDYAPAAWGGRAWRDTQLLVAGPAATELGRLVLWTHELVTRQGRARERLLPRPPAEGGSRVQVLDNNTLLRRSWMRRWYLAAIGAATGRVRITNAYFVPDPDLVRALTRAARRGVEVQLLLAGTTDVRVVRWASQALYERFLRAGVQVWEWHDRVLHAKTAVIDGLRCSVGSYNIDHRSLRHNLEVSVVCDDQGLGADLDAQFERDLAASRRVLLDDWRARPWWARLRERAAYALRALL